MASEGGSDLEAIGAAVGHLDLLDAVQSASAELSNHKSVGSVEFWLPLTESKV